MYRTSNDNNLFFNYSQETLSKEKIHRINNLICSTEYELKNIEYSLKLYKEEQIRIIQSEIYYFNFPNVIIDKSRKWLEIIKGKYDKRKKYDEKRDYDYLSNTISTKIFLNKPVNIYNIMYGEYEGYSNIVEFTCDDMEFNLIIPNLERLTVKNAESAHYGKMAVYVKTEPHCITMIAENYDENEIVEEMKKFFNNTDFINEIKENNKKA